MPPLSAYTPFESLLFFQSLATSDARPASFASISNLLRSNPFVRQNGAFNADRLSPEALEDLYATLMHDGLDRDDPSPSNSKKRKILSPRPGRLADGITHAALVPELVARLYARYRELVTRDIRDEERRYTEIKAQIERLQEQEAKPTAIETSARQAANFERAPEPMDIDVKEETPRQVDKALEGTVSHDKQAQTGQQKPAMVAAPEAPAPLAQSVGQPSAQATPAKPFLPVAQATAEDLSQSAVVNGQNRAQQAAAATPNAGNVPTTAPIASTGTPAARGTTAAHPSQVPPRPNVPVTSAAPPSIAAGKAGVAVATPTTSRVPQSSFQQWQLDRFPQSPYPSSSPKTATPQGGQATAKRPLPPTAAPAATPSAVPATPGQLPAGQTPVPIGQPVLHPRASQTPSAPGASFSESRGSRPRLSIDTPGSSTPWKWTPGLGIPQSPPSPVRPRPEDVSPISERALSPMDEMDMSSSRATGGRSQPSRSEAKKPRRSQATAAEDKAAARIKTEKSSAAARRKRAASTASSRSRLSVVSHDESPLPPDDAERELRASGRRKGAAAPPAEDQLAKGRAKRKRGASESLEQEPLPPETPKVDTSQYVLGARNFHRTAAPIMNDVATHKLASIFAKPLAERDAPGYHDLIYRPQDLKSIKSAIHQGSKAVNAATEAASTPAVDGESPAPAGGTPSKSAVLMLPKTEDLLPPKGIVNSAQLEKELIRMFANAIMFNPIPQRGFGPAFPMISDRGSRESTQMGDADEGGIISDSLEMFDDVQEAVTRWRAAERTADELANKNVLSLRRGSVSDFNTDSADDAKG